MNSYMTQTQVHSWIQSHWIMLSKNRSVCLKVGQKYKHEFFSQWEYNAKQTHTKVIFIAQSAWEDNNNLYMTLYFKVWTIRLVVCLSRKTHLHGSARRFFENCMMTRAWFSWMEFISNSIMSCQFRYLTNAVDSLYVFRSPKFMKNNL